MNWTAEFQVAGIRGADPESIRRAILSGLDWARQRVRSADAELDYYMKQLKKFDEAMMKKPTKRKGKRGY